MVLILTARLSKKLPTLYFHIPLFLVKYHYRHTRNGTEQEGRTLTWRKENIKNLNYYI